MSSETALTGTRAEAGSQPGQTRPWATGYMDVLAERADPSVALVGVLIPDDATGLALVRSLNGRPGCAVVAMSVRGGLRDAALAAGAVAFVEKSGDIDAVLDAVRAVGPLPV